VVAPRSDLAQNGVMRVPYPVPPRIGPAEFGTLGSWATLRCPREFDGMMRNAGGQREAGSRRWLIGRRRIGPVIRTLERTVDPLFRAAGPVLD
jgi:hypothetical protein